MKQAFRQIQIFHVNIPKLSLFMQAFYVIRQSPTAIRLNHRFSPKALQDNIYLSPR